MAFERTHAITPSPSYAIKGIPGVQNKYYVLAEELLKPAPPAQTQRSHKKRQEPIQEDPEGFTQRPAQEEPLAMTLENDAATVVHYTNEWVIRVPAGEEEARNVAQLLGHEFLREAHGFRNYFLIRKRDHPAASPAHSAHITEELSAHALVESAVQQVAKLREKRSMIDDKPQVVQEVIPVDHLRGLDAAERDQNRRNLENTAHAMWLRREFAVRKLIRRIEDSNLPIPPLIGQVKQEAARIGGLNVGDIKDDIIRQLERLQERRTNKMSIESGLQYESREEDELQVEDEDVDEAHNLYRRSMDYVEKYNPAPEEVPNGGGSQSNVVSRPASSTTEPFTAERVFRSLYDNDLDKYNEDHRHDGPKFEGQSVFLRAEEENLDPTDYDGLDDDFDYPAQLEQGENYSNKVDKTSVLFSDQPKENGTLEGVVSTLKQTHKNCKGKWIDKKVDLMKHIGQKTSIKALNKAFQAIEKTVTSCLHAADERDIKDELAACESYETQTQKHILERRSPPPDDLEAESEFEDIEDSTNPEVQMKIRDTMKKSMNPWLQNILAKPQPSNDRETQDVIPGPVVLNPTSGCFSAPLIRKSHNSQTLSDQVQAGLLLAELRQQDEEEREQNRRNLARTKSVMRLKTKEAVADLMRKIKMSKQPVRPLIDFLNQMGEEIDGVNVVQTKRELLKELEILHTSMMEEEIVTKNNVNYGNDLAEEGTIYLSQENNGAQKSQQSGEISREIYDGTDKNYGKVDKNNHGKIEANDGFTQFKELIEKFTLLNSSKDQTEESMNNVENDLPEQALSKRSPNQGFPTGNGKPNGESNPDTRSVMTNPNVQTTEALLKTDIAFMIADTLKIGSDNSFGPSRYLPVFNDERWQDQWYLQDYRVGRELHEKPINDLNVVPVYLAYNLSGLGVRIVVPDDGLEHDHDDLRDNYDPSISYDLNANDFDPRPRLTSPPLNIHGTRCAGVIAMAANNGKCGAGIAFRAKIGAIRMLDGVSTDRVEGETLKFKHYWVDIYSNSWGPKDDGKTLDPLGYLTTHALVDGITESRNGRGALYVFAAGNGKDKGDTCACDGYVSSIFTVVIATCDRLGHVTAYSERCSGIIATAFSAGLNKHHVVTTDVKNSCTQAHTGTSAAAPLVAGILALLLEANPMITWRDAQHLLIWTSEVAPLADNYGWYVNGFGFLVSQDFGFGMVNAYNLITAAKSWINVPDSNICAVPVETSDNNILRSDMASQFEILTDACLGDKEGEINYLEHVQLNVDIAYPVRGDLQIVLYSPMGTRSHLLEARPLDKSGHGFAGWTFSTLHAWGENPRGLWILQVFDVNGNKKVTGQINKLKLILHGTRDKPAHYANGPRSYDPFDLKE